MSFKKETEAERWNNLEFPWRWTNGDIAEVFESNSWKLAKVTRVHSQDCLFVKLLGSCVERSVHISTIRPCQTLPDDRRVVIEKDFGKLHKGARHVLPKEGKVRCHKYTYARKKSYACKIHFPANCVPHSLGLKKRPHTCLQYTEPFTRSVKKAIRNDKKRSKHQVASEESTNICGDVHQKVVDETHISASFYNRSEVFDGYRYLGVSSGPSDTEKSASSVGSCSFGSSPSRIFHSPENDASKDMGCHDDSLSLEKKHSFTMKKLSRKEIHMLELHAYRTTLRALYASGPISWDQESLMTNLRCALHISNDEHLLEVRNLISAEKGVSIR